MRKILALALMFVSAVAQAQTQTTPQAKAMVGIRPCATNQTDLGFDNIVCQSCTVNGKHVAGEPDIEFATEPTIMGIRKGGPADGKLEERDVLVAIDGQLITTRAAAIRYSWLTVGTPVRLTVRRGGVVKDVNVANDRASVHRAPRPLIVPMPGSAISRSSPPSSDHDASRLLALRSELTSSRPPARARVASSTSCPPAGASSTRAGTPRGSASSR
jgi:hypothetical protein